MATPRTLLALALLTASPALAGCTAPQDAPAPTPIPATTAIETARPTATAWQPDATLLLLSGAEASPGSAPTRKVPTDDGTTQRTWTDPNVGDGQAPEWTLLFYSETANQTRGYRVSTNHVEDLGGTPPSHAPKPLTRWTLDSPDAVGTALTNASFREAALQTDSVILLTLGIQEGSPIWQTLAHSAASGARATLLIDASNGTSLNDP